TRDNYCYAQSDPSLGQLNVSTGANGGTMSLGTSHTDRAFCDIRPPLLTQYKFYGAVPLAWGLSASATFQSSPGPEILASYTARNSEIPPSLGRALASGANGTAVIALVAPGTMYGDRLNQVDLRLSKTMKVAGGPRIQAMFDLYNVFNGNPVISQNNTF